jgi:hypothetical protein
MVIIPFVAEALPPQAGCDGLIVSRIDVRTHEPSSVSAAERATDAVAGATGLSDRRTQPFVVRAYIRLREGRPCTEQARVESERMLRAQRFVASAAVRAIPDGAGRVRITVDVVDEVPWTGSARISGAGIRALQVGNNNIRGRGLSVLLGTERGGAFRPGVKVVVGQYGIFGRPAFADLELHQRPLGSLVRAGVSEPFLTDGQRAALDGDVAHEVEYVRLLRGDAPDAATRMQSTTYNLGAVRRVGTYGRSRAVGLGGLVLMGSDIQTSEQVVVISDSGLVAVPDTELAGRFPSQRITRAAAMLGLRALSFRTVTRFETLRAEQDVGRGVEVAVLAGPELGSVEGPRDILYAADVYLGVGGGLSFASLRVRAQGERADPALPWTSVVGNAHFSWYRLLSESTTRTLTASFAILERAAYPVQLTLRDPSGGLLAAPGSREAGARRAMLRLEQRKLLAWPRTRASVAIGAFADAGMLWAGDVVYGRTTPVRGSLGLSLFGSVPSTGKRVYRLDVGYAVNPDRASAGLAVRISSGDRTGAFWQEPNDVRRARVGTAPPPLTRW